MSRSSTDCPPSADHLRRTARSSPPSCSPRTAGSRSAVRRDRPRPDVTAQKPADVLGVTSTCPPPTATELSPDVRHRPQPVFTAVHTDRRPAARRHAASGSPRARTSPAPSPPTTRWSAPRSVARRRRTRTGTTSSRSGRDLREKLPVAPEADTPADPTGRAVTQWLAPLFDELGFGRLTTVAAGGITADDGGKTVPDQPPLAATARSTWPPWNATLDKRPGGGGTVPPQSLVQECLNRTDAHLWGVAHQRPAAAAAARLQRPGHRRRTSSSTSKRSSTASCSASSSCSTGCCTSPASRSAERRGPVRLLAGAVARRRRSTSGTRALTSSATASRRRSPPSAPASCATRPTATLREDLDAARASTHAAAAPGLPAALPFVAEDRDALHDPGRRARRPASGTPTYFSSARLRAHALRRRGTAHGDL